MSADMYFVLFDVFKIYSYSHFQVSINIGFMRQLIDYELHIRGTSSLAWDPELGVIVVGD